MRKSAKGLILVMTASFLLVSSPVYSTVDFAFKLLVNGVGT